MGRAGIEPTILGSKAPVPRFRYVFGLRTDAGLRVAGFRVAGDVQLLLRVGAYHQRCGMGYA
jgi:hypothetical protein